MLNYWVEQLENDLYQDLRDCCSVEECTKLDQLALGFLPTLHCNACVFPVLGQQLAPELLPSPPQNIYVIGFNFGLFQVAGLLCEALLWESQNHPVEAKERYHRAIDLYFARTRKEYERAVLDDADELYLLKQHSGEIASLVLRFIALHELGHVVLGHADSLDMQLNALNDDVEYVNANQYAAESILAMETAADKFAIEHMLKVSGSAEQMWNNTLFICALFLLLDHIESKLGRPISLNHPRPSQRAMSIAALVEEAIGPPLNDIMLWLPMTMQAWQQQSA